MFSLLKILGRMVDRTYERFGPDLDKLPPSQPRPSDGLDVAFMHLKEACDATRDRGPDSRELVRDAQRENKPWLLADRFEPILLKQGFYNWLWQHKPEAEQWLASCFRAGKYGEDTRIHAWDGGYVIQWVSFALPDPEFVKDVTLRESIEKHFWRPPGVAGRLYMYLKSHPSKLTAPLPNQRQTVLVRDAVRTSAELKAVEMLTRPVARLPGTPCQPCRVTTLTPPRYPS